MEINPIEIKDNCRAQLGKYLIRAISVLPSIKHPLILDMGCGSGIPAFILSAHLKGKIYAVDTNEDAINYLKKKIANLNLTDKIFPLHRSVYDLEFAPKYFDIILAEGLFNIIGFEDGLSLVNKFIKEDGHVIIHDERINQKSKEAIIKRSGFRLIHSFILDEQVWWNDYYMCLEKEIRSFDAKITSSFFTKEMQEIKLYKERPWLFSSMYYVLSKTK